MNETIRSIVRFSALLFILLILSFGIQAFIGYQLGISVFDHLLILSYVANYLLVIATFILIIVLKNKKSRSLGFIFLGGFLFKMLVYFLLFNPTYKADDVIERAEFTAFFIPYALCLAYETYVLVTLLNRD